MPGPDLLPIAAFGDCAHEALELGFGGFLARGTIGPPLPSTLLRLAWQIAGGGEFHVSAIASGHPT
jgi:hypothetical protein